DVLLTRLFKEKRTAAGLRSCVTTREQIPAGRQKAVRRQTAKGVTTPPGSSRAMRLDPLSLPISFHAHDARADGFVRQVELHRERVVLHRAVRGMQMSVKLRVSDFLGVALRSVGDGEMLVLAHRDP